ncbi:MAG: Ribonuclease Y [candidate division WWE3 bacterium GW2011_GWA1_41_8]|uniref:Ribonuclease Y n=1 Tax=candidate division WWE3 bacterium GW2011_GWA1_41_8 TaxID=1619103 RepID=A0A0G1AB96_UNCKA|nr:MAG: Ribonuclease Y [candidate division WWE3 bacterium GW2011_GWA1_41_8]
MTDNVVFLLIVLMSPLSAVLVFYILNNLKGKKVTETAPTEDLSMAASKENVVIEANAQAKEIVLEAKSQALKIKEDAEVQAKRAQDQVNKLEKDIAIQRTQVETREKELENRARTLKAAKDAIDKKQSDVDELHRQQKEKLEQISSLTRDEARNLLLQKFDKELVEEKGKKIRQAEEDIKKDSERKAQEILIDAMRFGATDYIVEHTTSKVKLPDEELKGRIIGKEGRNIQTFEEVTGVELDLDSTPGEIIISSFDPVRREIAKVSLERLIADGRIQPAKIEELVEKTKKEIDHIMFKEGDNLCHRVGVYNLHKDLVQMMGRFKYRFSYGQNLIEHTLEETKIGISIAHELKANVDVVKMGCLLHDIGKEYNIDQKVIDCVAEHHEDKPYSSVESAIVGIADHVSGARPGARSEDYESYAKRMKDLEQAAYSFDGVDKAYAISAGREVRVFVLPHKVDDTSTALLAREIARKIELEQTYPGVVKVTVIRETRVSETAK